MIIAGGVLVPDLEDRTKKSFLGMGFDEKGIPVDVLSIYFLNSFLDNFSLLLVDEFLKMNGKDHKEIEYGKNKLMEVIKRFDKIYNFKTNIMFCSEFMESEEYKRTFQEIKEKLNDKKLNDLVLETVPQDKIYLASARDYPIHELTCVQFLIAKGFSLKIGPTKEKQYDSIMRKLSFDISFAYLLDAYALGTKTADKVVHYIPMSRGPNNGQRIFLEDEERKIRTKLEQGCDEALYYFCRIASVSGHLLGLEGLEEEEIKSLSGRKLKREAVRLVLDNIFVPYNGVLK